MASARPKNRPLPKAEKPKPPERPAEPWPLRLFDAVFRFLASLKLAVILMTGLATVLAFATFYETYNGAQAVAIDIYHSKWFALLMAMIGVNVLCAALIRFPWKKRQTGFVITHAGLIILLIGSFISIKTTDTGELYIDEGKAAHQYVREDFPVLRVQHFDPKSMKPSGEPLALPFRPGASAWQTEKITELARDPSFASRQMLLKGMLGTAGVLFLAAGGCLWWRWPNWVARFQGALTVAICFCVGCVLLASASAVPVGVRKEVLTEPTDPFRVVIKDYLPSATQPQPRHEPAEAGVPMLQTTFLIKPPNLSETQEQNNWIEATPTLKHGAILFGPLEYHFQVLDGSRGQEALEEFLAIPQNPLTDHRARFHYTDSAGKARHYDWILTPEQAQLRESPKAIETRTLPDSDMSVTFQGLAHFPTNEEVVAQINPGLAELLREIGDATQAPSVNLALFTVKKGDGDGDRYFAWNGLPLAPNFLSAGGNPSRGDVRIELYTPPEFPNDPGASPMAGLKARLDVVRGPNRRFYYRAIGRTGLMGLGPIKLSERIPVFGGPNQPMQLAFKLRDYIPSGRTRMVCEIEPLHPNQMKDMASPAALVEFSADGVTKEAWLFHRRGLGPRPEIVVTRSGVYKLSLDYDRRDLAFDVRLIDFDAQFDPGSSSRSTFRSDVTLGAIDKQPPDPVPFSELSTDAYFQFVERPRESFRKLSAATYEPLDGGEVIKIDKPESLVQPSDAPIKIYMNNPMQHSGWTFFQSSFRPVRDQQTGEETGEQTTVLSIRHDPAWTVIYGGCVLVVIGSFVQFYLRDAGKTEREIKASKQRLPRDESPEAEL